MDEELTRRLNAELLSEIGLRLVSVRADLYRVNYMRRAGLTAKERAFLDKRIKELDEVQREVAKVRERCQHKPFASVTRS